MQKWYPKSDQNGLQKGPPKWAKITKMGSKSHSKTVFKKNIEKWPFSAPLNVAKVCKGQQNRWFSCSGLGSLWGLFLGSFWEPKWRPKAWKSGSQKSFKNRSKKWSIFDRFWGPCGVPNGARKVQIRAPKSDLASSRVLRGSRGRFGTYVWSFWDLFWDDFCLIFWLIAVLVLMYLKRLLWRFALFFLSFLICFCDGLVPSCQ